MLLTIHAPTFACANKGIITIYCIHHRLSHMIREHASLPALYRLLCTKLAERDSYNAEISFTINMNTAMNEVRNTWHAFFSAFNCLRCLAIYEWVANIFVVNFILPLAALPKWTTAKFYIESDAKQNSKETTIINIPDTLFPQSYFLTYFSKWKQKNCGAKRRVWKTQRIKFIHFYKRQINNSWKAIIKWLYYMKSYMDFDRRMEKIFS